MAGRSSSKGKKKKLQQIRSLWMRVSVSLWLEELKLYCPSNRWSQASAETIKGICPFHKDTDPSFHINREKGVAKCFGCEETYTDPVKFLSAITKKPVPDVLKEIVDDKWGITVDRALTLRVRAELQEQSLKKAIAFAFNNILIQAATRPSDDEFDYCQPAIAFLTQRGIPVSQSLLQELPIGIFPHKRHLMEYLPKDKFGAALDWLGAAYFDQNPVALKTYTGALSFTYYSAPKSVGRFKLRQVPAIAAPASKDKPMVWLGNEEKTRGVFGLNLYQHLIGAEETLYTIEGEFDFLSMYLAEKATCGIPEYIAGAISGHGIEEMSYLKEFGFKRIITAGDHDTGGIGFNRKVLENTEHLRVDVFDWDKSSFASKAGVDPDQIVQDGDYDAFKAELLSEEFHVPRPDWVCDRITLEVNQRGTDPALRKEILDNYSECVFDVVDKDQVIEYLEKTHIVSTTLVNQVYRASTNDEEYVFLIEDRLREELVPLMHNSADVICYTKTRKSLIYCPMRRIKDALAIVAIEALDKDIASWCRAKLGEPDWLKYDYREDAKVLRPELIRAGELEDYFALALKRVLFTNVPSEEEVQECGAGIHYFGYHFRHVQTDPSIKRKIYVVNGNDTYLGTLGEDDGPTTWEQITIPRYKNLLFRPATNTKWSHAIQNIESLKTPAEDVYGYTLKSALAEILAINNLGWVFSKNPVGQDLEALYLAGCVLYSSAVSFFPYMNQTYLTADHSSGKSSFLLGLYGGLQFTEINLVEHVRAWDDWTAVGVCQALSNTKMVGVIDEFENPTSKGVDPYKAQQSRALLQLTRGNIRGAVSVVRGSPSGKARRSSFGTALFGGGINPMTAHVDVSRWNIIQIEKDVDFVGDPVSNILKHYTQEQLKRLRYAVTLLSLQHAAELIAAYNVVKEYAYRADLPPHTDNRFINIILPIVAMLHAAGVDSWHFTKRYLIHKMQKRATYAPDQAEQFLIDVLTTPALRSYQQGNNVTVASLLSNKAEQNSINTHHCGVYLDESSGTVVLHIKQILLNLLHRHPEYRGETHGNLIRQRLLRADTTLTPKEMRSRKLLKFLQRSMGTKKISSEDFVAANLQDLIEAMNLVSS